MPSVRPKLVEEGVPISAAPPKGAAGGDVAMMEGDNRFVIGGAQQQQQQNMDGNSSTATGSSLMNASSSNLTIEQKKRGSSLAKASKGSLINAAKEGKGNATTKRWAVQTSYVVGDEKKSGDSPNSMMLDEPTQRNRTSLTATSFQVPGGSNDYNNNSNSNNDNMNGSASSMHIDPAPPTATKFVVHPASSAHAPTFIVGEQQQAATVPVPADLHHHSILAEGAEKMEGVIDLSEKPPMVVLDGANIAYAYSKIAQGATSLQASNNGKVEPDARGIVVACNYFLSAGIRVLAVVPMTWTHREPHHSILQKLNQQGLLVPAPPRDDDDAYAFTVARREDQRAQQRGDGPGYVLSNDMFRDAIAREEADGNTQLKEWLNEGRTLPKGKTGPGRISYAFCDAGSMDDHGDKVLDLLPNPRHPLVQFVEDHRAASS